MGIYDDRRQWPGTVPPTVGAPARLPGSTRRTTNVDLTRPEGFGGPLVVTGSGRDMRTGAGGEAVVLGTAHVEVSVDYTRTREVTSVRSVPEVAGLDGLVGVRVGSGFRRAMAERVPDLDTGASLVHQLLDDLTPGTLISGSALAREGLIRMSPDGAGLPVDICAGWVAGGSMFDAIAETGIPLLGWGPPAPDLFPADDPDAWHEMGALAPASMRRRRRIDVGPVDGDAPVRVDAAFRDSYWEEEGTETVVHEYRVGVLVDPVDWTVRSAEAVPGPLPAPECPSAAASAGRLAGRRLADLRSVVRDDFTGTSTCTHLNDLFRSLADVPALASLTV